MPLSSVRIIDLSRIVSGPFCSALLADLGADVIKVEPPGEGDPVRQQGVMAGPMSSYFANYNRNKRSLTLDLYQPEGKQVLERLIAGADVLLENFRPDVLARMGFTAERLQGINPRLITCNINGFGTDGPYAQRPAFDFVVQAMSGFMSCNGTADGPPMRAGSPIADLVCGLYAALGICAALHGRDTDKPARNVSVSMLASMVSMLSFHATNYLNSGTLPPRSGNDHGIVAPYGLFRTQDGEIAIAPSNDTFYDKLLEVLDLTSLSEDPRFATNALRMANRAAINGAIEAKTMLATKAHWIGVLNAAGVPCGPVNTLDQVFADPQVKQQELAISTLAGGVAVKLLNTPIRIDGRPAEIRLVPPELGCDSETILREAGYGQDEITGLRGRGIV